MSILGQLHKLNTINTLLAKIIDNEVSITELTILINKLKYSVSYFHRLENMTISTTLKLSPRGVLRLCRPFNNNLHKLRQIQKKLGFDYVETVLLPYINLDQTDSNNFFKTMNVLEKLSQKEICKNIASTMKHKNGTQNADYFQLVMLRASIFLLQKNQKRKAVRAILISHQISNSSINDNIRSSHVDKNPAILFLNEHVFSIQ